MSLISMRVELANETDQLLSLKEHQLERGASWVEGKSPPRTIAPRGVARWHSEAASVLTGVEGHAIYSTPAPGAGLIVVGWNSPFVESARGNTFPLSAPPDWDVALTGGQGRSAVLRARVRRTARRRVPDFMPSVCGMGFSNSWTGDLPVMTIGSIFNELSERLTGNLTASLGIRLLSDEALPVTKASQGVCGGMVFGVMDYFNAHRLPPADTQSPKVDNALFRYLRDRLRDSFDFAGRGERWLVYSAPLYPDTDEGVTQTLGIHFGRSWVTYRQEWPKVRDLIDAGALVPLGLVQTAAMSIGDNHTVLAYAYEVSGQTVRLFIYDPNDSPGAHDRDSSYLQFDTSRTDQPVAVTRWRDGKVKPSSKQIYCMFALGGYAPARPAADRPADAMTFRQAHLREVGVARHAVLPGDLKRPQRPVGARDWMRSLGP